MNWETVETRLGAFTLVARDGKLVRVHLPGQPLERLWDDVMKAYPGEGLEAANTPVLQSAATQLREYAHGVRTTFELPLDPDGTPFQRDVWAALSDIPFGETRSYADIAEAIGKPGAARAVGQANRRNPLAPIVPCHRVLAADGGLGGYMGEWESEATGFKQRLLEHEGAF